MSIKKTRLAYERGEYYSFDIKLDEGTFNILFAGNLDLYWNYNCKYKELNNIDTKEFVISRKDGYIYELIEELYEDIINYNLFSDDLEYNEDLKKRMKESDESNPRKLCNNGIIDWHSDDYDFEEAARVLLEKEGNAYKITFVKGIMEYERPTFAIRICNSGTRYPYFNNCFMKMYNKLIDYENEMDEYHQISIKEYMEDLKLVRKKESEKYEVNPK